MKKLILAISMLLLVTKSAYSENAFMGGSLGTPGIVNLNIAYYGDFFGAGLSISGLHLLQAWLEGEEDSDDFYDDVEENSGLSYALFQANLDLVLHNSGDVVFTLSAAGGTVCLSDGETPENDMTIFYAGPCIHIIFYGFYTELGVAWGRNFSAKFEEEKTGIFPLVQIGYMARY